MADRPRALHPDRQARLALPRAGTATPASVTHRVGSRSTSPPPPYQRPAARRLLDGLRDRQLPLLAYYQPFRDSFNQFWRIGDLGRTAPVGSIARPARPLAHSRAARVLRHQPAAAYPRPAARPRRAPLVNLLARRASRSRWWPTLSRLDSAMSPSFRTVATEAEPSRPLLRTDHGRRVVTCGCARPVTLAAVSSSACADSAKGNTVIALVGPASCSATTAGPARSRRCPPAAHARPFILVDPAAGGTERRAVASPNPRHPPTSSRRRHGRARPARRGAPRLRRVRQLALRPRPPVSSNQGKSRPAPRPRQRSGRAPRPPHPKKIDELYRVAWTAPAGVFRSTVSRRMPVTRRRFIQASASATTSIRVRSGSRAERAS